MELLARVIGARLTSFVKTSLNLSHALNCSNNGLCGSWIGHFLCTQFVDNLILKVIGVLSRFISSDHKPILVLFDRLVGDSEDCNNCAPLGMSYTYNWSLATLSDINKYQCVLNELLSQLNTPCLMSQGDPAYKRQLIDDYYTSILCCIKSACLAAIPQTW